MQKKDLIKKCGEVLQIDRYEIVQNICEILSLTKTQFTLKENFSDSEIEKVLNVFNKLKSGMPLGKILQRAYFYGYDFYVNNDVLTPRQDSELIVFLADKMFKNSGKPSIKLLDLCCGSGCLGLTLKKINSSINLTLVDISEKALEVAKVNADNMKLSCEIIYSNMFANLKSKYDLIISNPPYIKSDDLNMLEEAVKNYDPIIALDGKEDGLYFYNQIANNVLEFLNENGALIMEIGFNQGEQVKDIFDKIFKNVKIYKDNGGNDRVVVCQDRR